MSTFVDLNASLMISNALRKITMVFGCVPHRQLQTDVGTSQFLTLMARWAMHFSSKQQPQLLTCTRSLINNEYRCGNHNSGTSAFDDDGRITLPVYDC